MWFDASSDTLNFKQNNITQQIGEELFIYGRADEAITDGQVIAVTGSYGTTGYVRFAPAPIGTSDPTHIIGLATEAIPKNGFGRITAFGIVHDLNTVAYADGDALWYDPTVTGGMTTTQPSAPNIKVQVGVVTKAAGGTNGSIQVKVFNGPTINDIANIQTSSSTGGQLLTYNQTGGYWKNTSLSAGTGISTSVTAGGGVTVTNTAPDQTVAITAGTGISVSGTYPSFTVANSGVTSLTGTTSQITVSASTGGVTLSLANPINVDTSGNAATVTNGVYTTGSYANPSWITSLDGSKITNSIDGGTF
jgi:hypothetical protein